MRVYHYMEACWALQDIRQRRMKSAQINKMNDPYEWNSVYSHHRSSQLALEKTREDFVTRYGVLCFSRKWNDILMWSHYADNHRGICLGFDVTDVLARDMEYLDEVLVVDDITMSGSATDAQRERNIQIIDRSSWSKYGCWHYEEEVRMHGERKERDWATGDYFVPFHEHLRLKEVIAGVRCPVGKLDIQDALNGYTEDVEIKKAARCPERFAIVIDEKGFCEKE